MADCIAMELLENRIKSIFTELHYRNIKVNVENGSKEGDGYMGLLIRALVSGEKNDIQEEIDTMVKCAPKNLEFRKSIPTAPLFNREMFYYTEIVPIYEKLQVEFSIPEEMKYEFVKCFAASNEHCNEFMVLENLKSKGYKMCVNPVLDYEHSEIALKLLGKLHALSFILEETDKELFNKISSQLGDTLFSPYFEYDPSGMVAYGTKALNKHLDCIENENHRAMVKNVMENNVIKKQETFYKSGNKKVISHGDFWINNMLYKYQDDKPVKAIPLDFQNCRYMSLANDCLYLFSFSSGAQLRRDYFWKLLDIYYNSLSEFLAICGFDVNTFCTRQEFIKEIREQAIFGLAMNVTALPIITSEEVLAIHELYSGNEPDHFHKNNEEYKTKLNDFVTDYVSFGFLK